MLSGIFEVDHPLTCTKGNVVSVCIYGSAVPVRPLGQSACLGLEARAALEISTAFEIRQGTTLGLGDEELGFVASKKTVDLLSREQ